MIGNHKVILIAAVDNNWAIGKGNKLPWHIPSDLKFFNSVTLGNYVVYGYNTLQSLPHSSPLQNRENIILTTKDLHIDSSNAHVAHSVDEVISMLESRENCNDVYIAGGQSIYKQFFQYCDHALITKVQIEVEGADAYMLNLDNMPNCEELDHVISTTENGMNIEFHMYKIHKPEK